MKVGKKTHLTVLRLKFWSQLAHLDFISAAAKKLVLSQSEFLKLTSSGALRLQPPTVTPSTPQQSLLTSSTASDMSCASIAFNDMVRKPAQNSIRMLTDSFSPPHLLTCAISNLGT